MALSAKAVRVFAAVEVLRDNQKDVRHALATLFEPDLAKFNGKLFDPQSIAAEINGQYKLGISSDVMAGFVDIFLQRGWLERVIGGEKSAFIVNCPQHVNVPDELQFFQSAAAELASEFREFIKAISPLSQIEKSDAELVDDLVEWLMTLDRVSEGNLRAASQQRYRVGNKIIVDFDEPSDGGPVSESTFLSARFVDHLFKSNSPHISFLVELGEVGLITEVVRDFQRPTTAVRKTDISIYLDAPLALDFLGLSGAEAQASIDIILTGVVALGGNIRIFRQSITEMQNSLHALLAREISHRTGPTADALRRNEVLEAFVREVASRPEKFLKIKGVGVVDQSIEAYPNEHKFFSRNSMDLLYSQVSWVKEDLARAHDAEIAALAMRKRAGAKSDDIFEVRHVVLTRNPTFPVLARRIAMDEAYIGPNHVGPVIHQRQLATAIWLRAGARADAEIPRRHILSSCRRVLTLRRNIVEKVHHLKASLSTSQAEQLELLLSVDRSTQVLMDKTLGSASIIDSSNIAILLEEMKKAQIEELAAESEEKIKHVRKEARERERAIKIDALTERNRLMADLETVSSVAEARALEAAEHARRLDGIWNANLVRVNRRIRRVRRSALVAAIAAFLVMSAASYFGNVDNIAVSIICFVIAAGMGIAFQFSSWVKEEILDKLFVRYDRRVLGVVLEESGLKQSDMVERLGYSKGKFWLRPVDEIARANGQSDDLNVLSGN